MAVRKAGKDLGKAETSKATAALRKARQKEASEQSIKFTMREVARVAYFDHRKLYRENGELKPPNEWDDDTAAAISHMGPHGPVPFDKNVALEKVMKWHGMYEKDNKQLGQAVARAKKPAGRGPYTRRPSRP